MHLLFYLSRSMCIVVPASLWAPLGPLGDGIGGLGRLGWPYQCTKLGSHLIILTYWSTTHKSQWVYYLNKILFSGWNSQDPLTGRAPQSCGPLRFIMRGSLDQVRTMWYAPDALMMVNRISVAVFFLVLVVDCCIVIIYITTTWLTFYVPKSLQSRNITDGHLIRSGFLFKPSNTSVDIVFFARRSA